jgi:hypothetical protein
MREDVFNDACTVFLEARHASGETHAVGVLIDNNLGVMAKDILLADSIDRVAEVMRKHPQRDGELTLERIVPMATFRVSWSGFSELAAVAGLRACNKPCNKVGKFSLIQPHPKSENPCKPAPT